jgi:hypothetical protein
VQADCASPGGSRKIGQSRTGPPLHVPSVDLPAPSRRAAVFPVVGVLRLDSRALTEVVPVRGFPRCGSIPIAIPSIPSHIDCEWSERKRRQRRRLEWRRDEFAVRQCHAMSYAAAQNAAQHAKRYDALNYAPAERGRASISLRTMSSAVTPSASALKFSTRRCRNTGAATMAMSSSVGHGRP